MGSRRDYYRDPDAPTPNSLVPGGSALVVDTDGSILMQRRSDSGNWSLPGGVMEIAVSAESTEVRFIRPDELPEIPVHDTVRLRLKHHAEQRGEPYLG
ncbi:hypothetical protein C5E45_12900 [Nocardia nova]|uniref:NUDIX domain-containing protein n=1 Tax=Nocardia nova TaxID=37330 RepID=A0A2S6AQL8_9NOCA|nr:hypothetical protein [Nocardia nova]PPJ22039.1 hypothetical protein C5E41_28530 [Nocardia nova]PPJ37577.1 hypothetical protein C5E45_12900 [Nocardia nova]